MTTRALVLSVSGSWRRLRAAEAFGVGTSLVVLAVALSLATDSFLRVPNLLDVARQASDYGIMAVGMVLLLAMAEVDLSVGSTVTLVTVVSALALRQGVAVPLAAGLALATGTACGLVNGLLAVGLGLPSIIVTLGTMSIYRGLALVLSAARPIGVDVEASWLLSFGAGGVLGVPAGIWVMAVVAAIAYVAFEHTPFGWRLQAIGSNAQAARWSGIPIGRYRVAAMTVMGAIAGVSGFTSLAFLQAADPSVGIGAELLVIAAAVIGGTPLSGGGGSIAGAVLGALVIAVIRNGLVHLGMSAYWSVAATGAIIIAAVTVSRLVRRQQEVGRG